MLCYLSTRDLDGDGKIDQWGFDYGHTVETVTFNFWSFLFQADGTVFNKDYSYVAFNETLGVEALQFICDLWNKYKVVPPAREAGTPEELLFESERVAGQHPVGACHTVYERV